MKEFTQKLIEKYNLVPDSYYTESPYPFDWKSEEVKETDKLERELQEKWKDYIPPGWYGFSLSPCPKSWLLAIDGFLDELKKDNSEFEIHQIKCKFGGLRFYLGNCLEDQYAAIDLLESAMRDKHLIY